MVSDGRLHKFLKNNLGRIPWDKGKKRPEIKNWLTFYKKGHEPWNKGKKYPRMSEYKKAWWKKKKLELAGQGAL